VSLAQEPTETDRSEFEDWMGDYLLDAGAIQSSCVKYTVIAHGAIHEQVENIETSESFLAVDKEKK